MTEHLAVQAAIGSKRAARFKSVLHRSDERRGGRDIDLLSLSSAGHLYPRTKESDRQQASEQNIARCLVVNPGDLVVNPMWLTGGSIAVSDKRGAVSPDYRVFRPSPLVWPRYMHHVLRMPAYMDQYRLYTRADTTFDRRVQQEDLDELPLPLPPVAHQRRIADFLDDQVARIDNIIAARRQQTDLIAENLQGQIDRLISIGSRRRIAPVLSLLRDGTHTPPPRVASGIPLLTAKNVKDQLLVFTTADTSISEADADFLDRSFAPRSDDVLLSVKGSVGNVAVVPAEYPRFQIERNLAVLRPNRRALLPEWLYWSIRGRLVQDQLRLAMGFSAQPGVYLGDLASLLISVPGIAVQADRVRALNAHRDSGADASKSLVSSVGLLTELKRSLITAAVTGEFDVSAADGSRVPV